MPVRTPADVVALLEGQVAAVPADPIATATERAKTIADLSRTTLKAIELAGLADRLAALERVLDK